MAACEWPSTAAGGARRQWWWRRCWELGEKGHRGSVARGGGCGVRGCPSAPFIGGQGGGDGSGAVAGGASSEGGVNGVGRVLPEWLRRRGGVALTR